ncbi:MAG: 30S ribosomal protein S18 [Candidatus Gracilibacteria bacterium]|jgi:small subunit ribosomal protein S18|nr:30S ribosomal protein S18 [Candidatus Gracilibacteria bacterium]
MSTYKGRKCHFCEKKIKYIDYKNVKLLRKYVTKYKKIVPKYYSGTCLSHQKNLARAIKNARFMALIPFTVD